MSFTSFLLRSAFERGDNKRDAGLETPEDIRRYDDIAYGGDARWQVLDVYRPKNETGKLPVIVSVHGGGWVYGDKERYQYYCMSLAQHGFAVVNYTYRLAPKFKFPASLEDTNLVFRWRAYAGALQLYLHEPGLCRRVSLSAARGLCSRGGGPQLRRI